VWTSTSDGPATGTGLEPAGVTYVVIRLRDPALKDDDGQPHAGVDILAGIVNLDLSRGPRDAT
jgi:hypothetical protein